MRACAKINLGLNVVSRRDDGYHNIETVFLPLPLYDTFTLEEQTAATTAAERGVPPCQLVVSGERIDCDNQNNLVVRAYNLLSQAFSLPHVRIVLRKHIPMQAGLGGGSSDAAHTLLLLNEHYHLHLTTPQLERYAATLGADCAFFIQAKPAYAEGIGDKLYVIPGLRNQLVGMRVAIVKPAVNISTREAYAHVVPHHPARNCLETVMQPIATWRDTLVNDFEEYAISHHIALREIRNTLYRMGAVYVAMTGSGSAMYAFLPPQTTLTKLQLRRTFPECYTTLLTMRDEAPAPQP